MNGDRSLVRAFLSNGAGNLAGPLSMVAIAPLLAHALGPVDRGAVAAATIPCVLATSALTLGIPEALTYAINQNGAVNQVVFRKILVVLAFSGVAAGTVFWLAAPYLSAGSDTVRDVVRLSTAFILPTQMLWAFRGRAQGRHQWRRLNGDKYLSAVARVGLIFGLYLGDMLTVESASLALIVAPLAGFLAYPEFGSRTRALQRGTSTQDQSPWQLLSFGSKVWLGSIAGILMSRLDQVLIAPLSNQEQLGLYAVSVNIGDIPFFATAAVATVLLATESKEFNSERILRSSRTLTGCVLVLACAVSATATLWLPAVFGEPFRPAISSSIVLIFAAAAMCPGSIAGSALTALGHPHLRSLALVYGLTVNVILVVSLVPTMGALGASLATLAALLTMSVTNLVNLRNRSGLSPARMVLPERGDLRLINDSVRRNRTR
jgi:O-antigen/teichoic acid export membrane protein